MYIIKTNIFYEAQRRSFKAACDWSCHSCRLNMFTELGPTTALSDKISRILFSIFHSVGNRSQYFIYICNEMGPVL